MSSPPPCRSSASTPFVQHMKANRGHAGLIPAADMNFWSMAGASEGPFPTLLLSPASLSLMATPTPPHTPPLSSHSKAWATPNVNDVSLAIVHGWPHLNGWLVPRPAPYNGLLSHSDLFSAFPPFHEERALSGSLSSLVLLRILESELNWKRWSKRWREEARERERVWRRDGGWKVSGEVDRDRAVSGFITRIVTVCSANNYQHRGMAVNLAYTDRLSLLLCLIGQGKSVLCRWKLWGLRKCAPASLMKSDERRRGGEHVEGGKSNTYMLNLQFRMSWNSSSVRERAQLGLTVWTDMELKGKQGSWEKKKNKAIKKGLDPLFWPHMF